MNKKQEYQRQSRYLVIMTKLKRFIRVHHSITYQAAFVARDFSAALNIKRSLLLKEQ